MNIFVLHLRAVACAAAHADQHVGKMLLEACQLLCGAHAEPADRTGWIAMSPAERLRASLLPYGRTHRGHPCAVWTRRRRGNYEWLAGLAVALADEYEYRFGKVHGSRAVAEWCADHVDDVAFDEADASASPFAQAMPEIYRGADAVAAYRRYYAAEKRTLRGRPATWTKREPPEWFLTAALLP